MEQEAAQELFDSQTHESLLVAVCRIAPAEGHVAARKSNQPTVGDGNAMGIGAEIAQHMFGPPKGSLGINDPVVAEQHPQPCSKRAWLGKMQKVAVELKRASMKGVAKSGDELAAEDTAEYADGQEEGTPGGDPSGVIRCEAAGGNDAVDMGMKLQALIPGVENAEETYPSSKMPGIASNLKQRLGTGAK